MMRLHDSIRQVRLLWRNLHYYHPWNPSWGATGRRQHLTSLFAGVNRWLWDSGVDYWLMYGTLLGYFREGGIIYHDKDIDFGLPDAAYSAVLAAESRLPEGFSLVDTSARHRGHKIYIHHRDWEADLYFFKPSPEGLESGINSSDPVDRVKIPEPLIYPLQEAQFLRQPTRVPALVEPCLTRLYGYLGADFTIDPSTGRYLRKGSENPPR